ncbi:uncharacterized protein DUF1080 [Flavobacteriaceae bacterium MAR_2010_105]|nr:uncharacterized protein DUF1080 [Flavobacteriaceae bacterium MAR_2010_105]
MKNKLFLVILVITSMACKQDKKENSEDVAESQVEVETPSTSEWTMLFDGTNYDQWRGYLTDEMYPEWTIEDGTMAFTPGTEGGKNIITKNTYTSFVLSLEWKISEGGNSGIFWSVYEDPKFKEAYQTGPEIQVLDNERHPDAKANPKFHQAGALYDMVQPKYDVCKPAGEWNECILKVDHSANQGSVTLNGTLIVEFPLHGEAWDNMVANSKFKGWEGFGKHHTGHIGLQDHGDKVWFRNIKIKEL